MSALFFAGLIAVICVFAGIFFLFGSVLLIVSIVKRRKVKSLQIFSISLYCVSLVLFVVPAGWLVFLRAANQSTFDDYVDTGVYVSSSSSEI